MIHFHSALDAKVVFKSAILLFFTLGITLLVTFWIDVQQTVKIFVIATPFLVHVILSFFVKKKESWLIGASLCTLFFMVVFTIGSLMMAN